MNKSPHPQDPAHMTYADAQTSAEGHHPNSKLKHRLILAAILLGALSAVMWIK